MLLVSELFRSMIQASNTKIVPIALMTVDHAAWDDPSRFCSISAAFTSRSEVYNPLSFDVDVPDHIEGRPPQCRLIVKAVTLEVNLLLLQQRSSPTVQIEIVLQEWPDQVEIAYPLFELANPTIRAAQIDATLVMPGTGRINGVRHSMTPSLVPGIF